MNTYQIYSFFLEKKCVRYLFIYCSLFVRAVCMCFFMFVKLNKILLYLKGWSMKKIKCIKLSELSKSELKEKQMKVLKGGNECRDKCGTISPVIGSAYGEWVTYFD